MAYNNYPGHQYYNYGYAQQAARMPQSGPSGYMPIYAPPQMGQAAQTPFIPPNAMLQTPPVAQPEPLQPVARPKHGRRAATPFPLKSALKKTATTIPAPAPAPAATASAVAPPPADHLPRSRKTSKCWSAAHGKASDHVFVIFKGDAELVFENVTPPAQDELRKKYFQSGSTTFRNSPWNMQGPDTSMCAFTEISPSAAEMHHNRTWRLICQLFTIFAQRGYSFLTSTNCTTSQPRLIFRATVNDFTSVFFLAYLSRRGRRISLINPPQHVAASFGLMLDRALPHKLDFSPSSNNIHIVELKRDIGGAGGVVEPPVFLMHALNTLMDLRFDLNATVPMARGGPLG
ncbi:hypothetical protein C8J57DRAFT_1457647, partial [Mycena rebaudengoi]